MLRAFHWPGFSKIYKNLFQMRHKILITGSTDGIGLQAAFRLAQLGHKVVLHGRDAKKGTIIRDTLRQKTGNTAIEYINADLTSFSDIEGLAEVLTHKQLIPEILINNAGVFQTKKELVTEKNIEKTFMVNYLSHFYLTYLLLPLMEELGQPKIVNVSSMIHANELDIENVVNPPNFNGSEAYGQSKLCNILHAKKIARKNNSAMINAVHPGVIDTKLLRAGWGGGGSDPNAGADQLVFAALELPRGTTGSYFEYSNETQPSLIANDEKLQNQLYDLSIKLIPKSV